MLVPSTNSKYFGMDQYQIQDIIDSTKDLFKGRTRYFVINSISPDHLWESQTFSAWSTTKMTQTKLSHAFMTVENVILIFTFKRQNIIQGVARMVGQPDPSY